MTNTASAPKKKKRLSMHQKQSLAGWAFLMPATLLIFIMSFYPMFSALLTSFKRGKPTALVWSEPLWRNYQFMLKDWAHYRDQLKLPDFGPLSQDRWAIQLIRERRAIEDIRLGHFELAVGKVSNLWASLPGAGYGQPEHKIEKLLAAYKAAGGVLA